MSETQTEYETDAEPTPGPVTKGVASNPERRIAKVLKGTDMVGEHNTHCDIHSKRHPIQGQEPVANADLIVAAFNAAQEAKEMGYDPVAAVEVLPELLKALEDGVDAAKHAEALESRHEPVMNGNGGGARPETKDRLQALKNALASAEGSGDE